MKLNTLIPASLAGLALLFVPNGAAAGVGGKAFNVGIGVGGDNPFERQAEILFDAEGGVLRGECGDYMGDWSEFDLFFIGFWGADFDDAASVGGDCSGSFRANGIHLYGVILLGGGLLDCNRMGLSGGLELNNNASFEQPSLFVAENPGVDSLYRARTL